MQLQTTYCRAASGWACNELGILQAEKEMDPPAALASMQRGCELGFQPACFNVTYGAPWATPSRWAPLIGEPRTELLIRTRIVMPTGRTQIASHGQHATSLKLICRSCV